MDNLKRYLLFNLIALLLVGAVMVYSSSYIYAQEELGASTHFFFKQVFFIIVGSLSALVLSKTKFTFWVKMIFPIHVVITLLLLLTFTPLGISIKGSHRWIDIAGWGFQPGEFIKYSLLLASIKFFTDFESLTNEKRVLYFISLFLPLGLLILQPDFGTFSISILLILFACFISNFRRKLFYSLVGLCITAVFGILFMAPYRVKRVLTYLDPWNDPQNSGFQIIQSYLAFANGHFAGLGIGNSNSKLYYLPEAYNDFIFSVIGEEVGFVGVLLIITAFVSFTYLGFKTALKITDKLNSMFCASVIFAISIQAFLNMGVVLGLLPTKGLNLPFISYGGSSLLSNLCLLGLFFSAASDKSASSAETNGYKSFEDNTILNQNRNYGIY